MTAKERKLSQRRIITDRPTVDFLFNLMCGSPRGIVSVTKVPADVKLPHMPARKRRKKHAAKN